VNAVEALDDYLLGLLSEVAPAEADKREGAADLLADAVDPTSAGAPAVEPATVAMNIDATADLLAEMDADPAFAAATPRAAAKPDITADLLAEMDADPAFAAAIPSVAAKPDITADLLAEMDADPAFAAATPHAAAKPDITADLLAEMDADPAFAAAAPVPFSTAAAAPARANPAPAAPAAAIGPVARRTPPRAAALPPHIQAMFQPTPVVADSHRRAADRSTRWLRLRCGEQTYALELLKVQEVVLPVPLLPLRGAQRSILGIMNLRGQVVPVLDLGVRLGSTPIDSDAQTRVVVLEENGETMGLRVSAVEDVTSLSDQHIEPPDNTRLCRISNHLFRGVARLGQQPMILLDASELLH
jgi:purine-binding chemotaxis protein CheW